MVTYGIRWRNMLTLYRMINISYPLEILDIWIIMIIIIITVVTYDIIHIGDTYIYHLSLR